MYAILCSVGSAGRAAQSLTSPPLTALFYTRDEIGLRIATYNGVAAVAGAFGGLLAFGIQNAHAGIPSWKLLFIVEGVPSVLLGFAAFAFLPNRPEETTMFSEQERKIALERANRRTTADVGRVLQQSTFGGFPTRILHGTYVSDRAYSGSVHGLEGALKLF